MTMYERWCDLSQKTFACRRTSGLMWDILNISYSHPTRKYHNFEHIENCLIELDSAPKPAYTFAEVAIWFHDIVYNPLASDNEEQSAKMAVAFLESAKMPQPFCQMVKWAICETTHKVYNPNLLPSRDICVVLDVDLASLGFSWEKFKGNGESIREEYKFVPDEVFWPKRKEILTNFLNRPRIYYTEHFRDKYEKQARNNLERAIFECP